MWNTLSFIVRDGYWKEGMNLEAKVGACTIVNFCDVILISAKALLKSKKFDLDDSSRMNI